MKNLDRVKKDNEDILSNLDQYALVKDENSGYYRIFDIKNQSTIYLEYDHDILVKLMIKGGVKIVKDIKEVEDPNFVRYMLKWDDEKQDWIKIREPGSDKK